MPKAYTTGARIDRERGIVDAGTEVEVTDDELARGLALGTLAKGKPKRGKKVAEAEPAAEPEAEEPGEDDEPGDDEE